MPKITLPNLPPLKLPILTKSAANGSAPTPPSPHPDDTPLASPPLRKSVSKGVSNTRRRQNQAPQARRGRSLSPRRTVLSPPKVRWVPSDEDLLEESEQKLLSPVQGRFLQRNVAGLNTISSILPEGAIASKHIILVHGFGGGAAYWLPVFSFLMDVADKEAEVSAAAAAADTKDEPSGCGGGHCFQIHAFDMPGFARSWRPKGKFAGPEEAINFVTGSIADWFCEMGFAAADGSAQLIGCPCWLIGHSFGAYVSAQFAMQYPQLVDGLVLVDPWGINEPPADYAQRLSLKWRLMLVMGEHMIVSPFVLMRAAGPLGQMLLRKTKSVQTSRWSEKESLDASAFFNYVYHCNASPENGGETLYRACTSNPVYPLLPLNAQMRDRLADHVSLHCIYGADSWMDLNCGEELINEITALRQQRLGEVSTPATYRTVPKAGHIVFCDNVPGFRSSIAEVLDISVDLITTPPEAVTEWPSLMDRMTTASDLNLELGMMHWEDVVDDASCDPTSKSRRPTFSNMSFSLPEGLAAGA